MSFQKCHHTAKYSPQRSTPEIYICFVWSILQLIDITEPPNTALNAYKVMYDAACSSDPISNSYCYIDAAANTSPADLYLYQLPLGINLPKTATGLTCSPCSKSILNIYSTALEDKSTADDLTGLKATYEISAKMVDAACGGNFAMLGVVSGALAVKLSSSSSSFGLMSIFVIVLGIWTLVI